MIDPNFDIPDEPDWLRLTGNPPEFDIYAFDELESEIEIDPEAEELFLKGGWTTNKIKRGARCQENESK